MASSASHREGYPHRELGIALIVLGALLLVFAVLLGGVCQPTTYSYPGGPAYPPGPQPAPVSVCNYPYAPGAVLLGIVGFIFLVVGIVAAATRAAPPTPVLPYSPGLWWPPPPPPPAQLVACRSCGRVHPLGAHNFCPNCGSKL